VSHFPVIDGQEAIRGHLLIEPVRHITTPGELTDDEAASLGIAIKNYANLLMQKLDAEHVYVFRINDKVPHFHVHLVPRFPGTPKEYWGYKITEWPAIPRIGLEDVKKLSEKLTSK